MPVSGFKRDDRVRTPSGRLATVVSVQTRGASTAVVRFDDGSPDQKFRQAALRPAK